MTSITGSVPARRLAHPRGVSRLAIIVGLSLARWGRRPRLAAAEFGDRVSTTERAVAEVQLRGPYAIR